MARAGPPADLPADCDEVCAQPERNEADTAAVLPANFRKSGLETVDESLPMTCLLSRFGETIIKNEIMSIAKIFNLGALPSAGLACSLNPVNGTIRCKVGLHEQVFGFS